MTIYTADNAHLIHDEQAAQTRRQPTAEDRVVLSYADDAGTVRYFPSCQAVAQYLESNDQVLTDWHAAYRTAPTPELHSLDALVWACLYSYRNELPADERVDALMHILTMTEAQRAEVAGKLRDIEHEARKPKQSALETLWAAISQR